MKIHIRGALGLLTAAILWGCSNSLVELGSELTFDFDGPSTVQLPDSLIIEADARGRSLVGLAVEYGDGQADSVRFSGAQRAGHRLAHLYDEPGDYTVVGRVQDGVEGTIMAELSVTVLPE